MKVCDHCGTRTEDSVAVCPECGGELYLLARPAGFWIRVGAYVLDGLVTSPLVVVSFVNLFYFKSLAVLMAVAVVNVLYKPCLEAGFGATVGKMICGLKVINDAGAKPSLMQAYMRFLPFLLAAFFGLLASWAQFHAPGFAAARSFPALNALPVPPALTAATMVFSLLAMAECTVAAFNERKRALHDYFANTYCVHK